MIADRLQHMLKVKITSKCFIKLKSCLTYKKHKLLMDDAI